MKILSILGSTGSIGRNTLDVVAKFPERFTVKALAAKSSVDLLADQIKKFSPDIVAVYDEQTAERLKAIVPSGCRTDIVSGDEGYHIAATHDQVDTVVAAMVGAAGLLPTLSAINAGKDIALANKETLVMAGEIVTENALAAGVKIMPVDSEHSAIFQCLEGNRKKDFKKILLTASGGPFLDLPREKFSEITAEDALKHPNWSMGSKISIDSSTLMNKGLEVIEAKWLFDVPVDSIQVVVHPQSIVHSMVAYNDGSVIAQMGIPDMKGAIAYALSYPERLDIGQPCPDFYSIASLDFREPDFDRFPCLSLAFEACRAGGTLPSVLNAANEVAVQSFLSGLIPYHGIYQCVRAAIDEHDIAMMPDLERIMAADRWARMFAEKYVDISSAGCAGHCKKDRSC